MSKSRNVPSPTGNVTLSRSMESFFDVDNVYAIKVAFLAGRDHALPWAASRVHRSPKSGFFCGMVG